MALNRTEVPGIRKEKDGILINTDNNGLMAYKKKKIQTLKMSQIENQLSELKNDMFDIKNLLSELMSNHKQLQLQ